MGARYELTIDHAMCVTASIYFKTHGTEVVDYALVLLVEREDGVKTIRLYDSAHGSNEMHRYTRSGGKQPAVEAHRGTLGEGMRAAMEDMKSGYLAMIEGWER
ncbi:MAG: hypothetical protein WD404_10210 [Solirubrobacterales bacterium]